jgi:predicted nucleic acid-binding protein
MNVYVDACVVIYRVEGDAALMSAAQAAFGTLGAQDIVCASPLVRMECLVKPLRQQDQALLAAYEAELAALRMLTMTSDVFDLAAELRARHALKTPDALHAACAIRHHCDEIWTNDQRLSSLGSRIPVRIVK